MGGDTLSLILALLAFPALLVTLFVPLLGFNLHGLRHGAGTRYYAQTKDLGRVASHLRHENIQTTRVYAKLADEAATEDLRGW
ncbi:MAG: tyrosine-type recombinase/integrase [Trueperaceae bacterium]